MSTLQPQSSIHTLESLQLIDNEKLIADAASKSFAANAKIKKLEIEKQEIEQTAAQLKEKIEVLENEKDVAKTKQAKQAK